MNCLAELKLSATNSISRRVQGSCDVLTIILIRQAGAIILSQTQDAAPTLQVAVGSVEFAN